MISDIRKNVRKAVYFHINQQLYRFSHQCVLNNSDSSTKYSNDNSTIRKPSKRRWYRLVFGGAGECRNNYCRSVVIHPTITLPIIVNILESSKSSVLAWNVFEQQWNTCSCVDFNFIPSLRLVLLFFVGLSFADLFFWVFLQSYHFPRASLVLQPAAGCLCALIVFLSAVCVKITLLNIFKNGSM